jgi:hypothetical protein
MKFTSYEDYENFLQAEGMRLVIFYRGIASPGSECAIQSIVKFDYKDISYRPLIINSRLGSIDQVTSNSFIGLVQEYPAVLVPVKNLEYLKIQCGDTNDNWTLKYWSTWDHGVAKTSWGSTNINASTNAFLLGSEFVLATNRIRLTVVANGQTNQYTQKGALLRPASVTRSGDMLEIETPCGSDIAIETSSDFMSWKTVANRPWFENTNHTSFRIDPNSPQEFYRVSVR